MKKKFPMIVVYFLIGVFFAGFISYSAVKEAQRNRKIEAEVENLREQASKIQNENESLAMRISYFETPEFQEKIAKEKLNLQKADENVVIIKPNTEQVEIQDNSGQVEETSSPILPNYQKWLNFFFKYN